MEINEYSKSPRIGPLIAIICVIGLAVAAVIGWPQVSQELTRVRSSISYAENVPTYIQGDAAIVETAKSMFNKQDAKMIAVSTPIYLYSEPLTDSTRPCVAEYGGVLREVGILPPQYIQASNLYTYVNSVLAGPTFGLRYLLVTYVAPAEPIPSSPMKGIANCVNNKSAVYSISTNDFTRDGTVIKN
jgi:hypothetical protein